MKSSSNCILVLCQRVRSVGNLHQLPSTFQEHITKAKAWKTLSEQQQILMQRKGSRKIIHYIDEDWPHGLQSQVSIINADMLKMPEFLEPRAYTLLLLDLPRGLNLDPLSGLHDNRFSTSDFESIVSQFAAITLADVFRLVVFHSPDDVVMVRSILMAACKGSVHKCVWEKINVLSVSKDKMYDALDSITIAAGSKLPDCVPSTFPMGAVFYGGATACGFTNVFRERAVELKLVYTTAEDKVVSPYQKPLRLLKKIVSMFSMQGEWIVDGCSGSGSGMVAAAQLARNVVAVDVDPPCSQYLELRMNSLENLPTEEQEIGETGGFSAAKVFRKEPMVNVTEGGRGSLLTIRGSNTLTPTLPGPPAFHPQVPGQQTLLAFKLGNAPGDNAAKEGTLEQVDFVPDSVGCDDASSPVCHTTVSVDAASSMPVQASVGIPSTPEVEVEQSVA